MRNDVDFDETKFERDEYGNIWPREDKPVRDCDSCLHYLGIDKFNIYCTPCPGGYPFWEPKKEN